ncbi:MAG: N-acetyltransferase [Elusimicrobia bacterium]|nr:N-acetyltransferase [Candidatus Obscuribacterium magneticum]
MKKFYQLRKARMEDVRSLHRLLNFYADRRELLPRSLSEIYENLQQFFVIVKEKTVVGCCALYVTWEGLAEVKALAVRPDSQRQGLGRWLLKTVIEEAQRLGVRTLFTLTIREGLFKKFGFKRAKKSSLPHKVWTECVRCAYFPEDCIETSLVLHLKKEKKTSRKDKFTEAFMATAQPMVPNEPG